MIVGINFGSWQLSPDFFGDFISLPFFSLATGLFEFRTDGLAQIFLGF